VPISNDFKKSLIRSKYLSIVQYLAPGICENCAIMKSIIIFSALSFVLLMNMFSVFGQAKKDTKLNVAILLFDGVQIIDYTGPYEVLGSRGKRNVFTVAEKPGEIITNMGMRVVPNYTFDNAPSIDILVLPGGGNIETGGQGRGVGAQLTNQTVMKWISLISTRAKYVMSVCNGAFFLAADGLLENMPATTTAGFIHRLKEFSPTTTPVYDKRFVDNGKIITTAGLSSGIDGAIHLVEKLDGLGWAKQTALNIEYNWQPDSGFTRGSIADMKLPNSLGNVFDADASPIDMQGDKKNWEEKWIIAGESPSAVIANVEKYWAKEPGWNKAGSTDSKTVWKLTEKSGQVWNASVTVAPSSEKGRVMITLAIAAGTANTAGVNQ